MHVRNEQNILPLSAGYLLNELKVDRLVIADNGSTDPIVAILKRLALLDERVRWVDASGPWVPQEIITGLAREACKDGADWILPNDADEFFWLGGKPFHTYPWPRTAAAVKLQMRHFVQWSWVRKNHLRALETMVFSAQQVGQWDDAQQLVETGAIAFVESVYPPKLVIRAAPDMVVERGNHDVYGVQGEKIWVEDAEVLHAPLQARDRLEARLAAAARLNPDGPPGESWHLRRLYRFDRAEMLDREWNANSTYAGRIGHRRWLRLDLRLRHLALRHRNFAQRCVDGDAPEATADVKKRRSAPQANRKTCL
jgi:hypothetical protein